MELIVTISVLLEITKTMFDIAARVQQRLQKKRPLVRVPTEVEELEELKRKILELQDALIGFRELGAILPAIVEMGQIWEELVRDSDKVEEITASLEEVLQEVQDEEKNKHKALYDTLGLLLAQITRTVRGQLARSIYRFSTNSQGLPKIAILREDLTFLKQSYNSLLEDLAKAEASLQNHNLKSFREFLKQASDNSVRAAELVHAQMLEKVYNLLRS